MKKIKLIQYILAVVFIVSLGACSENDEFDPAVDPSEIGWTATTKLVVQAVPGFEKFIWETNLLSLDQYWLNDILKLNIKLESDEVAESFTKIDIYAVAYEANGYNASAPFNKTGKLFTTINEVPESKIFETVSIEAEDLYELFKHDFLNDRSAAHLLDGDIFDFYWVIYHKDGTSFDSRKEAHPDNSWGVEVKYQDYAPPVWEGTFNYEYLEVSDVVADWFGIAVGDNGTISCTLIEAPGSYSVTGFLFLGFGSDGTLTHDFLSGLVQAEGKLGETWTISNVNGEHLDIFYEDPDPWYVENGYGSFNGKVRLSRTDGNNWPANIHTAEVLKAVKQLTEEQKAKKLQMMEAYKK